MAGAIVSDSIELVTTAIDNSKEVMVVSKNSERVQGSHSDIIDRANSRRDSQRQ
jgi:hypothetical protein